MFLENRAMLTALLIPALMLMTPPALLPNSSVSPSGERRETLAEREVVVRLRVLGSRGDPLAGMWVGGYTARGSWSGRTDEHGAFEGRVRMGTTERTIVWRVLKDIPPGALPDATPSEQKAARSRYREVLRSNVWVGTNGFMETPVVEDGTASGEFRAQAAYIVTWRWSNAPPRTPRVAFSEHLGPFAEPLDDRAAEMPFPVDGDPRAWLMRDRSSFREVRWKPVPPGEIVDLGVLSMDAAPADRVCVQVKAKAPWPGDLRFGTMAGGLTALAEDGTIYTTPGNESGGSGCDGPLQTRLMVPPGDYWLVPGLFYPSAPLVRIIDAISRGEDVESRWGIRRFHAASDAPDPITIDPQQIYKAVMGELPPTIDDRANALVEPGPAPTPTPTPTPTKAPVPPATPEEP